MIFIEVCNLVKIKEGVIEGGEMFEFCFVDGYGFLGN